MIDSPFVYLGLPVGRCHKRSDFWKRGVRESSGQTKQVERQVLVVGREDMFDQVGSLCYPFILHALIQIAFRGGR